jgi:hypothetical protein
MERVASTLISKDLNDRVAEATCGAIWHATTPEVVPDVARRRLNQEVIDMLHQLAPHGWMICNTPHVEDATGDVWSCTRRADHTGDHVAVDADTLLVDARWSAAGTP